MIGADSAMNWRCDSPECFQRCYPAINQFGIVLEHSKKIRFCMFEYVHCLKRQCQVGDNCIA